MLSFTVRSIGSIRNDGANPRIEIDAPYREAMEGLESFSHVNVLYWLHENDNPQGRSFLKVHPCKNPENPLTGVFATHSPLRPNPIALTRCEIVGLDMDAGIVFVAEIDAFDKSPLIDIKCYIPHGDEEGSVRTPDWKRGKAKGGLRGGS